MISNGRLKITPDFISKNRSEEGRLTNQENFLKGVFLFKRKYTRFLDDWDHDYSAFCRAKFAEGSLLTKALHEGHRTTNDRHCIGESCVCDFSRMFPWTVKNGSSGIALQKIYIPIPTSIFTTAARRYMQHITMYVNTSQKMKKILDKVGGSGIVVSDIKHSQAIYDKVKQLVG